MNDGAAKPGRRSGWVDERAMHERDSLARPIRLLSCGRHSGFRRRSVATPPLSEPPDAHVSASIPMAGKRTALARTRHLGGDLRLHGICDTST